MSQFGSEAMQFMKLAFIGLVLDIIWCVLKSVAKVTYFLACDLLKSVQVFCSSVRAAGDYLNAVEHGNSYICLQKVCARDFLDPGYANPVRTLQIGEEVRTSHSTDWLAHGRPWWGAQSWPGAVKLMDGSWIDLRELPADTAFLEYYGTSRCSPVAKLQQIEPDGGQYIVCKQQLDVQESCSLNSPVVRTLQRGEIIPAPRRAATLYLHGSDCKAETWVMRFEMEDHAWITCGITNLSCALPHSHYLMPASNREMHAGRRERRALAHIRYLEQEIKTYYNDSDNTVVAQIEISFRETKLDGAKHELASLQSDLASGLIEDNAVDPLPSEPEEVTVDDIVFEFVKLCFKGFDELLRRLLSELRPPEGLVPSSRCFLPRTMLWTSESTAANNFVGRTTWLSFCLCSLHFLLFCRF